MSSERVHDNEPADDLILLEAPVPPRLAEAFGYHGSARAVGFLWSGFAEDVIFFDGRISGIGDSSAFRSYHRHPKVLPHLADYNLGYSESQADYALIVDRQIDLAHVAPVEMARDFLRKEHYGPPDMTPDEIEEVLRGIQEADTSGWREIHVDPRAIRQAMEEHRQALAQIASYLHRWPHV